MPPRISSADRQLIAAYSEAALRLERQLRVASGANRQALLLSVDPLLQELEEVTRRYIRLDLGRQFMQGSEEAIEQLQKLRGFKTIQDAVTPLHREALQHIADTAAQSFGSALAGIRRNMKRLITESQKKQVVKEILIGEATGTRSTERVRIALEDEGLTAVQVGNRKLNLDHYASVITHTIVAEAHNTGAATRYMANGVEYGRRIERADAPDLPCQWMRDKIVWLGNPAFFKPIHPNCMGGVAPYQGDTSQAYRSIDDPRIPAKVRKALSR